MNRNNRAGGLRGAVPMIVMTFAILFATMDAQACSVCFGNSDTPITKAANGAILFMLAVLVPVLGSFLGFIFYLVRRQSRPLPDHEILGRMLDEGEGVSAERSTNYGGL